MMSKLAIIKVTAAKSAWHNYIRIKQDIEIPSKSATCLDY